MTGKIRKKYFRILIQNVAPYSPVVHQRFGETYSLYLQRRKRISQARETSKKEAENRALFVDSLTLKFKVNF
jgi:hypothetical protein